MKPTIEAEWARRLKQIERDMSPEIRSDPAAQASLKSIYVAGFLDGLAWDSAGASDEERDAIIVELERLCEELGRRDS